MEEQKNTKKIKIFHCKLLSKRSHNYAEPINNNQMYKQSIKQLKNQITYFSNISLISEFKSWNMITCAIEAIDFVTFYQCYWWVINHKHPAHDKLFSEEVKLVYMKNIERRRRQYHIFFRLVLARLLYPDY